MSKFNTPLPNDTESTYRREPIFINDDHMIPKEYFFIPPHYFDTIKYLLVSHGEINDRIEKLAFDISEDFKDETIHLMCVLKGGSNFFSDLCNALKRVHTYNSKKNIPFIVHFVRVKSYEGTESTGKVEITGCDVEKLHNKHVLFVEDIIDTGLTMSSLIKYLKESVVPASIRVASLVEKRTPKSCGFKADYVGYSIPDVFVVGYGLDFNEVYRDFNHLGVINDVGYNRYKDYHH